MKRLLALIGAVALIVGAIGLRQLITGDDDGDGGGGGGGDGDDSFVFACLPELDRVCRSLPLNAEEVEVVVEDAADTMAKLVAGDSGYDAWMTFSPWPEVVGFDDPEDSLGTPTDPLGSSALVLAVPDSAEPCGAGTPVDWKCLGDNRAAVGMPPATTGLGLLLLGNAASGYFGTADFATNDFDPAFNTWLVAITANDSSEDPLADLLRAFPPTRVFDAVGTTQLRYDDEVPGSRAEDQLPVVEPNPQAVASIVAVPVGEGNADRLSDVLDDIGLDAILPSLGWGDGGPDDTGLPDAGVMYDLLTR